MVAGSASGQEQTARNVGGFLKNLDGQILCNNISYSNIFSVSLVVRRLSWFGCLPVQGLALHTHHEVCKSTKIIRLLLFVRILLTTIYFELPKFKKL